MTGYGQTNPPAGPPLIAVEGSYQQMGAELGARTRDLVAENVYVYLRRFRDDAGLSDADVMRWGSTYWHVAQTYDPAIAAMLEGLAGGADQPIEHITALNARTEILFGTGYRDEGCTSLAILGRWTEDGHTLLAQNWDWHPEQRPVTFLLATRDTDGFSVLTLAEAGMLAKSGLNSAGLGVCANLLVSDRDAGGEGVPYHYLLRGVLQARRMSQAHRRALDVQRVSSGNLLIADAGGEAIALEVTPGAFGHCLPDHGLLTHANHFASGVAVADRRAARSALTLLRPTRALHLLEDTVVARRARKADVVHALRDHYSYPDSICRHLDPEAPDDEVSVSVYSLIMDLDAGQLYIANHPVCANAFARWDLVDVFTPDAVTEPHFTPNPDIDADADTEVRAHA